MSDFQAIADRVEIEALRGEFTDAAMMRDYDRAASLFTPGGALRMPNIPAELTAALPRRPPVRARRRIPFNSAVTGGACMAGLVNVGMLAVLLSGSPVAVLLFVVVTIIGTILAIGAMIAAQ